MSTCILSCTQHPLVRAACLTWTAADLTRHFVVAAARSDAVSMRLALRLTPPANVLPAAPRALAVPCSIHNHLIFLWLRSSVAIVPLLSKLTAQPIYTVVPCSTCVWGSMTCDVVWYALACMSEPARGIGLTFAPLRRDLRADAAAPPKRERKHVRRLALAYRVVTALLSLARACARSQVIRPHSHSR